MKYLPHSQIKKDPFRILPSGSWLVPLEKSAIPELITGFYSWQIEHLAIIIARSAWGRESLVIEA